jgi:hypothetical protein
VARACREASARKQKEKLNSPEAVAARAERRSSPEAVAARAARRRERVAIVSVVRLLRIFAVALHGRRCSRCGHVREIAEYWYGGRLASGWCATCRATYKRVRYGVQDRLRRLVRRAVWLHAHEFDTSAVRDIEYRVDFSAIARHLGPRPGAGWQIDHIVPLAAFDFTDPAEAAAAFLPENHQWLSAQDNARKNSRHDPDRKRALVESVRARQVPLLWGCTI